jgi:hypothetical protein
MLPLLPIKGLRLRPVEDLGRTWGGELVVPLGPSFACFSLANMASCSAMSASLSGGRISKFQTFCASALLRCAAHSELAATGRRVTAEGVALCGPLLGRGGARTSLTRGGEGAATGAATAFGATAFGAAAFGATDFCFLAFCLDGGAIASAVGAVPSCFVLAAFDFPGTTGSFTANSISTD